MGIFVCFRSFIFLCAITGTTETQLFSADLVPTNISVVLENGEKLVLTDAKIQVLREGGSGISSFYDSLNGVYITPPSTGVDYYKTLRPWSEISAIEWIEVPEAETYGPVKVRITDRTGGLDKVYLWAPMAKRDEHFSPLRPNGLLISGQMIIKGKHHNVEIRMRHDITGLILE